MKFFPGRSIGFSYDLHFGRLPRWLLLNEGRHVLLRLPRFKFLWNVYWAVSGVAFVLFFAHLVVFGIEVYRVGMIGGWRFR